MTPNDILRMAREQIGRTGHEWGCRANAFGACDRDCVGRLERFAALVAAAEREACAKIADAALGDNKVSDAIRARGEKP